MSLLATFRVLIPEFSSVSDEELEQRLNLSALEVNKTGFKPEIRDQLIVYLTADRMAISYKQKGAAGEVVGMSEGGLSVTYASGDSTGYRKIYKRLVKAHTITPLTRMC